MVPRTSPAGCCAPGGAPPVGFWADRETAARFRTRASSANRMRFMGPALSRRSGDEGSRRRSKWVKTPTFIPGTTVLTLPGFKRLASFSNSLQLAYRSACAERVIELVRMFATFDFDGHRAADTIELVGAGVGNDSNDERGRTAVHGPGMLEDKSVLPSLQGSRHTLDGYVARGA